MLYLRLALLGVTEESLDPDKDPQLLFTFNLHSRMVAALWLVISRDSLMSVDAVTALVFDHLHKS